MTKAQWLGRHGYLEESVKGIYQLRVLGLGIGLAKEIDIERNTYCLNVWGDADIDEELLTTLNDMYADVKADYEQMLKECE